MRLTLDSNILVYAHEPEDRRSIIAREIITNGPLIDLVLTAQVLGEFLNVIRRKHPARLQGAIEAVSDWLLLYPIATTSPADLLTANDLAQRYRLQFWDSAILAVARAMAVDVMLTEDLQDGATVSGISIVNPFNPANRERVAALLTPPS